MRIEDKITEQASHYDHLEQMEVGEVLRSINQEDRLVAEAVGQSANPANYLLAKNYIETLQTIAGGPATKTVYLPYEASNLMGSIGGIKDMFKGE